MLAENIVTEADLPMQHIRRYGLLAMHDTSPMHHTLPLPNDHASYCATCHRPLRTSSWVFERTLLGSYSAGTATYLAARS